MIRISESIKEEPCQETGHFRGMLPFSVENVILSWIFSMEFTISLATSVYRTPLGRLNSPLFTPIQMPSLIDLHGVKLRGQALQQVHVSAHLAADYVVDIAVLANSRI